MNSFHEMFPLTRMFTLAVMHKGDEMRILVAELMYRFSLMKSCK